MKIKYLTKKFFISSIIKFISSLGLISFNITVIYLIDKNTLGVLNSAISLIVFLSIFTKFGLNIATLKFTSIFFENKDLNKINQVILQTIIISGTLSSIIALIIIIFEKDIAYTIYKDDEIRGVLKIFAITLPIFTFVQLQKSIFKSFKIPELSSLSDIGSILFLTLIMMTFFHLIQIDITIYRISLFFLFSCLIIFSFNNFILFYTILKNYIFLKINKFSLSNKDLVKSLPDYFSIDFVNFITVWGSIFLCSFFYDFTIVGSFSSIYWFAYSLLFFPLVLNSIYAPYYAIDLKNHNKLKQRKLFFQNRNLSGVITIPIFLILFIFSDFFLKFFLNINSDEYNLIFKILLINSLLRIIFGPQTLFLNMSNEQKKLKKILIYSGLLQLMAVTISLVYFDLKFLAISFLISNLIKYILLRNVLIKQFYF